MHEPIRGTRMTEEQVQKKNRELSSLRSKEVKRAVGSGTNQWSSYPQRDLASPTSAQGEQKGMTGGK